KKAPGTAQTVLAFWRLANLYEKGNQFRKAVQLTQEQGTVWVDDTPLRGRVLAENGSLQLLLGDYKSADKPLQEAVAALEKQEPINLVELPSALNNLALVALARERQTEAERLATRVVELYRQHELPDDVTLIEAQNVRGLAALLRGEYAVGLEHFR